jgi:hypothetical protein
VGWCHTLQAEVRRIPDSEEERKRKRILMERYKARGTNTALPPPAMNTKVELDARMAVSR